MDSPATYISLYSGGGGLDMGFKRAVPGAQCVALVEHEASAAALLVDHVEAELLDAAPVFTDAFSFPAGRFHGLVGWIIGGPPCQPFSVAGKRRGADDPRNLWPLTLRMVGEIQPRGCFFENVGSADSLWYIYEEVIPGLQHLGYEVKAGIFSAAEVGAPHNRERIFILADSAEQRRKGAESERVQHHVSAHARNISRELADTACEHQHVQQRRARGEPTGSCADVGNADQPRPQGRHEPVRECRNQLSAWPPGPKGDWSGIPERYWPAIEPGFRVLADGVGPELAELSRAQQLRIAGNGVVPQTAERAFNELSSGLIYETA